MSSAKWPPFCLGLNVLTDGWISHQTSTLYTYMGPALGQDSTIMTYNLSLIQMNFSNYLDGMELNNNT